MSMWRPPDRIRFDAQPGRWPTAEQAAASRLFSPIRLGPTALSSRTWVPAMVPWRATEEGFVTANVLDWYCRFAQGRPGAIVVEATGVRDVPSGPLLRIGDDRFIPGLQRLVETVREASGGETRLLIQLIDFLAIKRRPDPHKFLERFLTITPSHRTRLAMPGEDEAAVRARLATLSPGELEKVLSPREWEALSRGLRERVTDCELPHIRSLPQTLPPLFAQAARRAQIAGFDGVELHYAHSYTMASFLSATNDRSDGYGGAPENRIRLPLEVYSAVRDQLGGALSVGCRLLADECIEGGSGVEDAAYFTRRLAAAGMDFISLSRGGKFDDALQPKVGEAIYPYTGPSGYECMPSYYSDARGPFDRNRAAAFAIRSAVRAVGLTMPIIAGGGVHNFDQAEAWLAEGAADAVSIARQALADPDWFTKVRSGQGAAVRLCKYTNYCEALDQRHREVTCELWDRLDLEAPGTVRSKDGKRRLVAPETADEPCKAAPQGMEVRHG
jgi:2,4-dienoyl-CoA reductase-like NADH-dependent reductase (Old Yellow Enzyme family)